MLVIVLGDCVPPLFPVVAVLPVGHDVDGPSFVRRQAAQNGRALLHGKLSHDLVDVLLVGLGERGLQRGVGGGLLAAGGHAVDVDVEALLQGAVLPHGAVEVVRRAHGDDHRLQVGRIEGSQRGLVAARVGPALGSYTAVAPRLGGQPLDSVVAVGRLLGEGVPLPLGLEAAPHVLADADVAAPRIVLRLRDGPGQRLVVGRAL